MMRVRQSAVWAAIFAAGAAWGGWVGMSWLERAATFHPSRDVMLEPATVGLAGETVTLGTSDGETIAGWFVPAPRPIATILFLHGNAGNMGDRLSDVAELRRAGFSTLIIDYRGYGRSSGSPSEEGIYRDTRAAWDHLIEGRGVAPGRAVLLGESLGAAASLHLAAELRGASRPQPGAIVLVGAFTSALDMGRLHFPWLPVRWFLHERFDNLAAVREVDAPLLVIHGDRDEVAPVAMGRRLYEASASPVKELLEVPMAGHATLMIGGRPLAERMAGFVGRALDARRPSSLH